jgi:hypothetical protein
MLSIQSPKLCMEKTPTASSSGSKFKATVKSFPLISITMVGYYAQQPLVAQKNIATLFAYLTPQCQCTHLMEQTGTTLFFGWALTPAPKGPTSKFNHRKKQQIGKNQAQAKAQSGME